MQQNCNIKVVKSVHEKSKHGPWEAFTTNSFPWYCSLCQVGVPNCQLLSNQITSLNLCLVLKPCLWHYSNSFSLAVIAICNFHTKLYRKYRCGKISMKNKQDENNDNSKPARKNITIRLQRHFFLLWNIKVENSVHEKSKTFTLRGFLQRIFFWFFTVSSWRAQLPVVIKSENQFKFVFCSQTLLVTSIPTTIH